MPIFALTGSLASGKTLVLKLLEKKGAVVFDADKIVHRCYRNNVNNVCKKISLLFPEVLCGEKISREKLGAIVFSDRKKLKKLEKIIHPIVIGKLKRWVNKNRNKKGLYVAEVPLLFENKLKDYFDGIILVDVRKDILIRRIMNKLSLSKNKAVKRLSFFAPIEEKKKLCDFIVDNSFSIERLKKEVNLLWDKLSNETYDFSSSRRERREIV